MDMTDNNNEDPANVESPKVDEDNLIESVAAIVEDDAKKHEASTASVADGTVDLIGLRQEALKDAIEAYAKKIGSQNYIRRIKDDDSKERQLLDLYLDPSDEIERVLEYIEKEGLSEDPEFTTRLFNKETKKPIVGDTVIYSPKKVFSEPLTGRRALVAYKSRTRGEIRHVDLLESGFSVELRAPNIVEQSSFIRSIATTEISYGRELGACYFSFADFVTKREAIFFVLSMVVNSTLQGWDDADYNTLLNSIRLPAFNHLLMQVAAAVYPKGYPNFRVICPVCGTITEPVNFDMSTCIRNRFSAVPKSCIGFLEKNRKQYGQITKANIDRYASDLGMDGKTIEIDDMRYTLRVPTLAEYIETGAAVVTATLNDIRGSKDTNDTFIAVNSRSLLTYLPWISKLETLLYEDDDPSVEPIVSAVFEDTDTISEILADLIGDAEHEAALSKQLLQYINDAQLSMVCYSPDKCSSCGEIPTTKTGMITLDPLSSFFTQVFWSVAQHFQRKAALSTKTD